MNTDTYIQSEIQLPDLVYSPSKKDKREQFEQFHKDNPSVYCALLELSLKFKRRHPKRKLGIKMLFEVIRWNYYIITTGGHDYKINNNYAPFYARLIMTEFPELKGAFEIRASIADKI